MWFSLRKRTGFHNVFLYMVWGNVDPTKTDKSGLDWNLNVVWSLEKKGHVMHIKKCGYNLIIQALKKVWRNKRKCGRIGWKRIGKNVFTTWLWFWPGDKMPGIDRNIWENLDESRLNCPSDKHWSDSVYWKTEIEIMIWYRLKSLKRPRMSCMEYVVQT